MLDPVERSHFVDRTIINNMLTVRYAPLLRSPRAIELHPAMWDYHPAASRLYVVPDPSPEMIGGIELPDSHNEQTGIGIIFAGGPAVGMPGVQYPGATVAHPANFLYRTVIFASHMGKPLRLDFIRDSAYDAVVLVMCDRDIWAANWDAKLP